MLKISNIGIVEIRIQNVKQAEKALKSLRIKVEWVMM